MSTITNTTTTAHNNATVNNAPTNAPVRSRRRAVTVTLWVAQAVLAAFFIFASSPKLLGDPAAVAQFQAIGFGEWFRYLTGACELAGAIGLLIPRLCGLASAGLAGVMVGATLTNLFLLPGMAMAAPVTLALGIVFALIAYARRSDTRKLLAMVRGTARGTARATA